MPNTWDAAAKRVQSGDLSDLIEPLDYRILELLPDFDTNMGGLYQLGETARRITDALNNAAGMKAISSGTCGARLKLLTYGGLARMLKTAGNQAKHSYQKTERGEEVLKAWLARQNS